MNLIPLSQGLFAIVDESDFDFLNRWSWSASKQGNGRFYAKRYAGKSIPMHHMLLKPQKGEVIDHINGNGLDNRRSNLRICTQSQNMANRGKTLKNTSGFKGVFLSHNKKNPWISTLRFLGKNIHIGYFDSAESAALAYDKKAKEVFGEFAKLNFPNPHDN